MACHHGINKFPKHGTFLLVQHRQSQPHGKEKSHFGTEDAAEE